MHNWYAIESEAAFRRREWEREVAADALAAEAASARTRSRAGAIPHGALARLRSLTTPRLPFTATLKPECRTAVCL